MTPDYQLKTRTLIYGSIALAIALALVIWAWRAQPDTTFYFTGLWMVVIALLLWWGNRQLTASLDRWMPWNKAGNWRLFAQLIAGLVYLLLLVNITYVLIKMTLTADPPTRDQIIITNVFGAFIFIPVFSIYFSVHFLKHWRKSELEAERMQKENMRSQLNSLKSQLDPHFLFNNLNILSALVDQDASRSKVFIEKFSGVYRSLLKKTSDDLIPLKEELEFIEDYIYLLRTRFDNHIQFTINVNDHSGRFMVPPLTLQMLIENAIKHNTIDEKNPLAIHLLQLDDEYLIVSNSLNENRTESARKGSGLSNIRSRYAYFTEKPLKVSKTSTHFEVHIPLLQIENA